MTAKRKSRKTDRQQPSPSGWASMGARLGRWIAFRAAVLAVGLSALAGMGVALDKIEVFVHHEVGERHSAVAECIDVPQELRGLADADVLAAVQPALGKPWLDHRLCQDMASRASQVGWVERVEYVRRRSDARFEIKCAYRSPFALVDSCGLFMLVDRAGTRLPGTYHESGNTMVIRGVAAMPPDPGQPWPGDDLKAALQLTETLRSEPFSPQVVAVSVANFEGREDARRSHVDLQTDLPATIRWGSAPGHEVEENSIERKLAILRENYRRHGRADALQAAIDVATYPNAYAVAE